jgi:mono/diheme cytochrome c family protein
MQNLGLNLKGKFIFTGLLLAGVVVSHAQPNITPQLPPLPVRPAVPPVPGKTPVVTAVPVPAAAPAVVPNAITVAPPPQLPSTPPDALKFDAENKEYTPKPAEPTAPFTFWLTNTYTSEVVINRIQPSCGCTTAKAQPLPWHVAPGASGSIELSVNLAGKSGEITKSVTVDGTSGMKNLILRVHMPAMAAAVPGAPAGDVDRVRNMQMALAERQVVFKGECASCHAPNPTHANTGPQLFSDICANCHESPNRASMVPDLKALRHPTNADYWRTWVTSGRAGSMMPAFSQKEGGPLSNEQIEMLVTYLSAAIPSTPPPAAVTPAPAQNSSVNPPVVPIKAAASTLK